VPKKTDIGYDKKGKNGKKIISKHGEKKKKKEPMSKEKRKKKKRERRNHTKGVLINFMVITSTHSGPIVHLTITTTLIICGKK
jgi:hypothetical protein